MNKYNYAVIESWWRHNGIWDREQASGPVAFLYRTPTFPSPSGDTHTDRG